VIPGITTNLTLPLETVRADCKLKCKQLLNEFGDRIWKSMCTLGKTDAAEMKIKLITDEPVVRGPYRMPIIEEENLRKLLEVLLINGITPEKNSRSACEVQTLKVLCQKCGRHNVRVEHPSAVMEVA
jgi:hypothetical protein